MKVKRFSPFYFGLFFGCICCLVTPLGTAEQPVQQTQVIPVKVKQVDVITLYPDLADLRWKKVTVDVRTVARNLHDEEMFNKAIGVLIKADNAYLSSGTVNLLKTSLNNRSVEVRQKTIILLGFSRNPEAIELTLNNLRNDPVRRVRYDAAKSLGRLAGEEAIPALKVALAEDSISTAVIVGFSQAGGKAVPLLIEMLKDEIKRSGGNGIADTIIYNLSETGDSRIIRPLIDIISRPTSPSDQSMSRVQLNAATILTHFATDWQYSLILKYRPKFAEGIPATPRESRRVKASDRARIIEALQNAGYDIPRLVERSSQGFVH